MSAFLWALADTVIVAVIVLNALRGYGKLERQESVERYRSRVW